MNSENDTGSSAHNGIYGGELFSSFTESVQSFKSFGTGVILQAKAIQKIIWVVL